MVPGCFQKVLGYEVPVNSVRFLKGSIPFAKARLEQIPGMSSEVRAGSRHLR